MAEKERLDVLVQRQAGVSRSKAQGLIQTGQVYSLAGEKLDKAGIRVDADMELVIKGQQRFVSRGGDKLEGAFENFRVEVAGKICLDAGASTGGFTDCLLQHGAARVFAVDVGYGQLAWSLQQDVRVTVMDRFNVRNLTPEDLDAVPTFFTVDCSFISLKMILPAIAGVLAEGGEGVALIKPQFEAGKDNVGKGGVVRDEKVRAQTVEDVVECARALGFQKVDVIPSPLLGPAGNHEYLAYLQGFMPGNVRETIAAATPLDEH